MDIVTVANNILGRADAIDEICKFVANGGSLVNLCRSWQIPFGTVTHWIRQDKERTRLYDAALNDRKEWERAIVLQELAAIASSDIRELFNESGSMRSMAELPDSLTRCVSAVELFEEFEGRGKDKQQIGWTRRIKLWDKMSALNLMSKILGMQVERHQVDGSLKLEDIIASSYESNEPK